VATRAKGWAERGMLGVVVVEHLAMIRAGTALMISEQPDMAVAAEADTADAAMAALRRLPKRSTLVVLVGLGLPGERDERWLIRTIRDTHPTLPILATGNVSDGRDISRALFMGADGFVHHGAEPDRFLDALRRTAQGSVVLEGLPKNWFGPIADELTTHQAVPPALTDREVEVLQAAAEGLTARQIGSRLGVRERTVTTHLSRIYKKLGASGRIAAISAAGGGSLAGTIPGRPALASASVAARPHRPRTA